MIGSGADCSGRSPAQKVFEWSGSVAMDYGQFRLMVRVDSDDFEDFLDTVDDMAVLNAALDGTGIGQYGPVLTVLSPHQNNFEMRLTVEVWDGPVADDIDDWEEVFEARLDVDEAVIQYDSPTLDGVAIPVPAERIGRSSPAEVSWLVDGPVQRHLETAGSCVSRSTSRCRWPSISWPASTCAAR